MFFVYILKSLKDNQFYTGYTNNLKFFIKIIGVGGKVVELKMKL